MSQVRIFDDLGSYVLRTASDRDHLHREMVRTGKPYEGLLLECIRPLMSTNSVAVDVGANIGNHSIALARHGAIVHAVEPNPKALMLLRANIEANSLLGLIVVHEVGLAESRSRARSEEVLPDNLGGARAVPSPEGEMDLVPWDDLEIDEVVRLLKVDVEGGELSAIRACLPMIESNHPIIIVELHDTFERRAMEGLLAPTGYRRFPLSFAVAPTFLFYSKPFDIARVIFHRAFFKLVIWFTVRLLKRALLKMRPSRP